MPSLLKSKNPPGTKTRLTPEGFGWWSVDMHVFFPWGSCNHSYHSLQPKDTANWCLPITKWLLISLWKRNRCRVCSRGIWEMKSAFLFLRQLIFQKHVLCNQHRLQQTVLRQENPGLRSRTAHVSGGWAQEQDRMGVEMEHSLPERKP